MEGAISHRSHGGVAGEERSTIERCTQHICQAPVMEIGTSECQWSYLQFNLKGRIRLLSEAMELRPPYIKREFYHRKSIHWMFYKYIRNEIENTMVGFDLASNKTSNFQPMEGYIIFLLL